MKISKVGIDLIKSFEGCYLEAYRCPANVWTIGWGTTEPINGVKPHAGMTITQQQADDLLIKNLKSYEDAVNKYVTYSINQNQFDALTSFAYNCGNGALKTSTLLEKLNKGDIKGAADQFNLWVNGGGKKLNGLVRRRAAEKELFLEEMEKVEKQKINLNGIIKEVEVIKQGDNNFVKLQDLRDSKITIDYDSKNKVPVVQVVG